MKIINKNQEIPNLKELIQNGKILIYPTDTIYGIGCNALNEEAVSKIREIKQRDQKPFSVIAPSIEWIKENCIIPEKLKIENYLPGPPTIILEKKDINFLKAASKTKTLGVRIPDYYFTKKIQKINIPFITTSINLSGEPFAKKIEDIDEDIKKKVDLIIDAGELNNKPSKLIINGEVIER